MGNAIFWYPDPVWDRLHKQRSWAALLKDLSLVQRVSVDCKLSFTAHRYHCQLHREGEGKTGYYRQFLAEGYGDHPLGAIRIALTRIGEPLAPTVRSKLLWAMIDYLAVTVDGYIQKG